MLGHHFKGAGEQIVRPDFANMRIVTHVFERHELPARIDRDVVHHVLAFAAVEEHVNRSSRARIGWIVEAQPPKPAVARKASGSDKIKVVRIIWIPTAIFWTL